MEASNFSLKIFNLGMSLLICSSRDDLDVDKNGFHEWQAMTSGLFHVLTEINFSHMNFLYNISSKFVSQERKKKLYIGLCETSSFYFYFYI